MSPSVGLQPVLVCACLAAGLLFDPMGFLRMALFCSVVHELGHVIAYRAFTGHFPVLRFRVGGIALEKTQPLSLGKENMVLLAGPLFNFLLAAGLGAAALYKASYGVYFLAAVSLCMGLYNLLPIGVLDGARLLQNLFPAQSQAKILRLENAAAFLLSGLLVPVLWFAPLTPTARMAAILAAAYLWMQQLCA